MFASNLESLRHIQDEVNFLLRLFVCLLMFCFVNFSCNRSPSKANLKATKVDSLFINSFKKIQITLDNKGTLNKEETTFVVLTSCLSGIFIQMKSGWIGDYDFSKSDLIHFEDWYKKNKNKIEWNKVQRGLRILNSNDISNSSMNELQKLRIK